MAVSSSVLDRQSRRLTHFTPLRYPGGKARLALFVKRFGDEDHGDAQAHTDGYPPIDPDDGKGVEGGPGMLLGIELECTYQGV